MTLERLKKFLGTFENWHQSTVM